MRWDLVTAQKETRSRERRQKSKVAFVGNENAVGVKLGTAWMRDGASTLSGSC